jgi:hypothetical protein
MHVDAHTGPTKDTYQMNKDKDRATMPDDVIKPAASLNDAVDQIYLDLCNNAKFQHLLSADRNDQSVNGIVAFDDAEAAKMVREHAEKHLIGIVKNAKLADVMKALKVVMKRYGKRRGAIAAREAAQISAPIAAATTSAASHPDASDDATLLSDSNVKIAARITEVVQAIEVAARAIEAGELTKRKSKLRSAGYFKRPVSCNQPRKPGRSSWEGLLIALTI